MVRRTPSLVEENSAKSRKRCRTGGNKIFRQRIARFEPSFPARPNGLSTEYGGIEENHGPVGSERRLRLGLKHTRALIEPPVITLQPIPRPSKVRDSRDPHPAGIHKFARQVMMLERKNCPHGPEISSHFAHSRAISPVAISSMSSKRPTIHPIFLSSSTLKSIPRFISASTIPGRFLPGLRSNRPEYFARLKELVQAARWNSFGGGFYEPILVSIPPEDQYEQITRLGA